MNSLLSNSDWNWIKWRKPLDYSVQFSSVAQSSPTLWPHESQHARPPYPSPTPRVHPNPCPLTQSVPSVTGTCQRPQGESAAGLEPGFPTPLFQGFPPHDMLSWISMPSPVGPLSLPSQLCSPCWPVSLNLLSFQLSKAQACPSTLGGMGWSL